MFWQDSMYSTLKNASEKYVLNHIKGHNLTEKKCMEIQWRTEKQK